MGKDLRKTKSNDGEGPQKNQELWWGRTSEKPKIMGETQENKRKIEKTPEGSIKTKEKLMKTPEWSLPEWSMYLFMERVVRVLIRLYKQFMKSKGHKC